MKKILLIAGVLAAGATIVSCGGAKGNDPGDDYMPDMRATRAYETYGYNSAHEYMENLQKRGIRYTATPVPGTIARGDMVSYGLTSDSASLARANTLRNPFDTLRTSAAQLKEAERLYLVNCGICHGANLQGNGPLFKGGDGPYPVAPPNLVRPEASSWTDGYIFHVITVGKGQMGSYASQLHPEQRWWVINYIRSKQKPAAGGSGADSATAPTATAQAGSQTATPSN